MADIPDDEDLARADELDAVVCELREIIEGGTLSPLLEIRLSNLVIALQAEITELLGTDG